MDPLNKIELAESLTHTLKEMTILNVNSLTVCCLMICNVHNMCMFVVIIITVFPKEW